MYSLKIDRWYLKARLSLNEAWGWKWYLVKKLPASRIHIIKN